MRRPCAIRKPVTLRLLAAVLVFLCSLVISLVHAAPARAQPDAAGTGTMELAPQGAASAPVSPAPAAEALSREPVGPPCPPELSAPALPPPTEPSPAVTAPDPAPRQAPQRVLLIGDSLMQNGCLGSQLEARFKQRRGVAVARWAKQSTGLSRKDYFDWAAKLRELIGTHKPDLIVAVWGANDCQSVTNARGNALAAFGTPAWDDAYGARVEEVAAIAHDAGAALVLIGLPCMANPKYGARIARLNSVVEQHAKLAGGIYLPTWEITSTDGAYLARVKYNGKTVNMRQKDGIHLSSGGAGYVSDWLMDEMGKVFPLPK